VPPTQPHDNVAGLLTSLIVPIAASVVMQALESLVESLGWRVRLVRTGWDLCMLALGSAAGIFVLPGIVQQFGSKATLWLAISLVISFLCATLVMHIRKTKPEKLTGPQAVCALLLGGTALTLPWYFALYF